MQVQVSHYVPFPWYAQPLGIIAVVAALTLVAGVCWLLWTLWKGKGSQPR